MAITGKVYNIVICSCEILKCCVLSFSQLKTTNHSDLRGYTFDLNLLTSSGVTDYHKGMPRTPILPECRAVAGDFSGFRLSLLPPFAGFSTDYRGL